MDGLGKQRRVPTHRAAAIRALAFLAGFYVLALGLAAAMVVLIIASVRMGRIRPQLLGAALTAAVLVHAVVRVDSTSPHDPLSVDGEVHPRLRRLVHDTAHALGAAPPDRILLVASPQAYVYQRSRLLGLRAGATTLVLGITLLQALSVDEVRAVVAHELGHLHRRDTRLGGVVYRARAAIGRAAGGLTGPLGSVFAAYERAFLRSTMRIARAQEEAADVAAIEVAGPVAAAEALLRTVTATLAYDWYIDRYVDPVLAAGRWPIDLVEGFRRILSNPGRVEELARLRAELAAEEPSPFDSHPPLAERVAAALAASVASPESPPRVEARSLLESADAVEHEIAALLGGAVTGDPDAGVPWADVARDVWTPRQQEEAEEVLAAAAWVAARRHEQPGDENDPDDGGDDGGEVAPPPAEAETLLDLLDSGGDEDLVWALFPSLASLDGIEREEVAPRIVDAALFAVLGDALVTRAGCRWRMSDAGPLELVDRSGFAIDLERLAALARQSHDGRQLVRSAIAPAAAP